MTILLLKRILRVRRVKSLSARRRVVLSVLFVFLFSGHGDFLDDDLLLLDEALHEILCGVLHRDFWLPEERRFPVNGLLSRFSLEIWLVRSLSFPLLLPRWEASACSKSSSKRPASSEEATIISQTILLEGISEEARHSWVEASSNILEE
jgi:hypothetical protein